MNAFCLEIVLNIIFHFFGDNKDNYELSEQELYAYGIPIIESDKRTEQPSILRVKLILLTMARIIFATSTEVFTLKKKLNSISLHK